MSEDEKKGSETETPKPVFKLPGAPHRPKPSHEAEQPAYNYGEEKKPEPAPYGLSLLPEEKPEEGEEEPEQKPAPSTDVPCLYTPPFWRYDISVWSADLS